MNKQVNIVSNPTRLERLSLRTLILVGLVCIGVLLYLFFIPSNIGNILLYIAFITSILYFFLNLSLEWYHYFSISIPERKETTKHYTVDIFTTFCEGEPYSMIEETLKAIVAVKYPHTSILCDEANDEHLKKLCKELGIIHVTRNNRVDAKAGNINNALKQTSGDLCVILDPDHIPRPELLDDIVPCFDDETLGYVQIVQAYYNHEESYVAKGAAQQTYQFYGPMMMSMNSYGTVQAIGANCTFRRAALDSIGGHAAGLAEDMHTALQLHAKGWKSLYIPKILTRGLVPNTLSAYYKQQLKWAKGTFDILFKVYPKLFFDLSFRQKMHYALISVHYLSGFFYLVNFLIPILSLFFCVYPLRIDFIQLLFLGLPFIVVLNLIRLYVQRWVMEETERGIHVVGGLLQISTWWIYILGFFYAVVNKKVPYIPTPKGREQSGVFLLLLPNIVIALVSVYAIYYGLQNNLTPFSIVMAVFAFINVFFTAFITVIAYRGVSDVDMQPLELVIKTENKIKKSKRLFWKFRHGVYKMLRRFALPLFGLAAFISISGYVVYNNYSYMWDKPVVFFQTKDSLVLSEVLSNYSTFNNKTGNVSFENMRGIAYEKGVEWIGSMHALSKKVVKADLFKIKNELGATIVERSGPGIYDKVFLETIKEFDLNVCYAFKIPYNIDFTDRDECEKLRETILGTVEKYADNKQIKYWNLNVDIFDQLSFQYRGEELIKQLDAYRMWMQQTMQFYDNIDSRLCIMTVKYDTLIDNKVSFFNSLCNKSVAFEVILADQNNEVHEKLSNLKIPYYIKIGNKQILENKLSLNSGVMVGTYQDEIARKHVNCGGLIDIKGRNKQTFNILKHSWSNATDTFEINKIKILKPAKETTPGEFLKYSAIESINENWKLMEQNEGTKCEWYMLKINEFGDFINIKYLGTGSTVSLQIPEEPLLHYIYLKHTGVSGIAEYYTMLNTPLVP